MQISTVIYITVPVASGRRFWFFEVTNNDCIVTLSECQKWILNNSTNSFEHDFCLADVCPANELFAIASGFQCVDRPKVSSQITCYLTWRPIYTGSWRDRTWRYAIPVSSSSIFSVLLDMDARQVLKTLRHT